MYRDGSDKERVVFNYKKAIVDEKIRFTICRQNFECENCKGKMVTPEQFDKLTITTINDLLYAIEADWPLINKSNAFKNIYVLDKQKEGYFKYKVKWLD